MATRRQRAPGEQTTAGSDHALRQQEIRNKARGIFIRHGYQKTTCEDIGRACGLGKTALYHYYAGKEEIYAAVVRAEWERVLGEIKAAVEAESEPRDQLVAMVKTSVRVAHEILGEVVSAHGAGDLVDSLPTVAKINRQYIQKEVEFLREILDRGHAAGVFRKVSSPLVPVILLSGLAGMQVGLLDLESPPPVGEAIDAMLDLFFEGLCR